MSSLRSPCRNPCQNVETGQQALVQLQLLRLLGHDDGGGGGGGGRRQVAEYEAAAAAAVEVPAATKPCDV